MESLVRDRRVPCDPYSKLTLRGIFGKRIFTIHMTRDTGVTTADLAKEVEKHVGVPVQKQRILFKGLVLDPPDTGVWAPRLESLSLTHGDRIHVLAESEVADMDSVRSLEGVKKRMEGNDRKMAALVARTDAFFRGYFPDRECVAMMAELREDFECMKSRYRAEIEVLSAMTFDHRNCVSQAHFRQTVDHAQRQIDKCTQIGSSIFQRIAIRHCPPRPARLPPINNRFT